MFKNPLSNFPYCIFILLFVLSVPVFSQTNPACTSNWQSRTCSTYPTPIASGGSCQPISTDGILVAGPTQTSQYSYERFYCNASCNGFTEFAGYSGGKCNYMGNSCPSGQSWQYNGTNFSCVDIPPEECLPPNQVFNGECITPVDEPQDCGSDSIDVTAYQLTSGQYACMPGANYPCGEGMTPGTVLGTAGTINICDQPNGDSSSSSGNNSSSNHSDGGEDGDGSGSSSGNETSNSSSSLPGCPVPANSTCPNKYEVNGQWYCASGGDFCSGGGGSSASSSTSGGSGSSVGAGQCDPTAKNYLECLNTKELEIPSEKGSYDGTDGTSTEDRIGELEGELQDVVDQIKSEINDTVGVNLSSGGTLTDQCYQIMKVQVCFGWARWSQHLALIANAILAMAYIASFIIIMRQ